MSTNILDYDEGYDAFEMDEPFDPSQSKDWQEGYFDAQAADCGDAC